jgi:hypothetical protein
MKLWTRTFAAAAAFTLTLGLAPVSAQDADTDGPGRGVARLSLMNGDVSVRRGDSGDWVAGAINAPLLAEDRVYSGPGSRAEVQFDYFHRIRLAEETEIRLSELENRRYQIQVARGTVTFSALEGGDAQVEISTPGAAVRPVAYGLYRVTVLPDGSAEITVRQGEAEIFTPSGSQRLRPGRTMKVRLDDSGRSEFQFAAAIPRDAWDEFNERRDRDLRRSRSYQYVSRDIYGAEDLDPYGTWTYVSPYGWCWRPVVAVGWAPYRFGRWAWLDWYGWTWISYDPWGWAPYHYGRWFHWGGAWHWYPGGIYARHYWRPALVAFFGWNSWGGVNFGVGYGRWGWVPLAPFEPYYPWYGSRWYGGFRNRTYIDNSVRIVNNVNITNVYRNARIGNAVTVVDGEDFSRGRVGRAMRVDGNELARAHVMQGALPVAPQRDSLRLSDREARGQGIARSGDAGNERFFSRREVARIDRVPFEEQRRALEQFSRRSEFGAEGARRGEAAGRTEGIRVTGDARGEAMRSAGERAAGRSSESSREAEGGWRRGNDATRSVDIGRGEPARTQSGDDAGWRRFGDPRGGGRVSGDEGDRTGRGSAFSPRTNAGETDSESRAGWRSFGDPARSSTRGQTQGSAPAAGDSGWRSFGSAESRGSSGDAGRGSRVELPRIETPRSEPGRWSTRGDAGGGNAGRSGQVDLPRIETPRGESGRWSTRGDAGRTESPRSESPRGQMPQIINGSGPVRSVNPSGGEQRTDSPRDRGGEPATRGTGGRGNESSFMGAPMSRSERWSTGGGEALGRGAGSFGSGDAARSWSTGRMDAGSPSRSGDFGSGAAGRSWSTGRSEAPSPMPGGSWSTGGTSRSEPRSEGPSWTPRSGGSGGFSAPRGGDFGGSRGGGFSAPSGGSFGGTRGGGGFSAPRGGDFGGSRGSIGAPSSGGGGMTRGGGGVSRGGGGGRGGRGN